MTREQRAAELIGDQERLQYDMDDPERIEKATQKLTENVVSLITAIGEYVNTSTGEANEDSAALMKAARSQLVEDLGFTTMALAKLTSVFRVDGEEVFSRIERFLAGPEDAALTLSDL